MTPEEFVKKWQNVQTKEKSASQEHFIDLCRLLGEPTPNEADPDGSWYCFEKGAQKTGGGDGWADVWKQGHFGWEYKGKGKDLKAALKQLQSYAFALQSPPLLIVSDLETIVIHTAFTNAVQEIHPINLERLLDPASRQKLKWAFTDPDRLRPGQTRESLTRDAAERFGNLALSLHQRGFEPHRVAHFLNRLLFCLFAEDCDLLPRRLFSRLLESAAKSPEQGENLMRGLFAAMAKGGPFGVELIDWFNGGLFNDDDVLSLTETEYRQLLALSHLDWSCIEPAIFGTLFERGLDPAKRSQLGAHYTDRASIMRLIDPVIREPLEAEWTGIRAEMESLLANANAKQLQAKQLADSTTVITAEGKKKAADAFSKAKRALNDALNRGEKRVQGYLTKLRDFKVLDPACGSGNFLYLALQTLKDLEHRAILEAHALGMPRQFPAVGPEAVHGVELNPYAAELARVTVWIGEIQWMLQHGYNLNRHPVLRPLDTIEQRDAVINRDGSEPEWPAVNVIVGNPPFLGDKKMLGELGKDYVEKLRGLYVGRVPGGADLVCYWFEKARAQIEAGNAHQAGLVATNSIRGGANRTVLDRITENGRIFNAWSDEPWINEGAAVRVSLVCFGSADSARLDGKTVPTIHADLTAGGDGHGGDLTSAQRLKSNIGISYIGPQKNGPFDITGSTARTWLTLPNPHGKPNSVVVRPWSNGMDITRRPSDTWIVDFGGEMGENEAVLFETPFAHITEHVKPERVKNNRPVRAKYWWRHGEIMPAMRAALGQLPRYIGTPRVSKYRFFVWLPTAVLPDCQVVAIARSDDTTFGVLQSRLHELWSLGLCTWLGKGNDPRYTPTTTFETFPFPTGVLTDSDPDSRFPVVAAAARRLNELRENWLNPPGWVERVPEVVAGYPDRLIAKPEYAAELKNRTLTNLYNLSPAWLAHAHTELDHTVAEAYGWTDYSAAMSDEEILTRLLELNRQQRE